MIKNLGKLFYNLNHRTYTAKNSSRVIRTKGRADEKFSINIIIDLTQDFNPDVTTRIQNHLF